MPNVTINGLTIEVPEGTNVVKAAEQAGLEVPHYCYHPGLSIAGNCRMCLVDIKALSEKQPNPLPKLQIGCNTFVQEGMVIETDNEKVTEARRGVLEFLLINHPIDCPICDQAGECKLQEYYMDYGSYRSRMDLDGKVHKEKATAVGPNIMLDQERCILCTRCIRFLDEVTETNELLITERGDQSALTLANGKSVDNPYATNIVDICPVGALTSREFRFNARVWYLDNTESVCTGCATGCNIDVYSRDETVYRIKPRANHEVNGYWMCDAGRRTHETIVSELRLRASYSRGADTFEEISVAEVSARSAGQLASCDNVAVVASSHTSMEEGYLLACIAEKLGTERLILVPKPAEEVADDGKLISSDRGPNRRGLYMLGFVEETSEIAQSDGFLIVRSDPAHTDADTWEAPLEGAKVVVCASETETKSGTYADHILGVSTHFESEGSFVNRDGRLQAFQPAIEALDDAVDGWRALASLLEALGGPRYESVEAVFEALARVLGLGDGRTLGSIRPLGLSVGSEPKSGVGDAISEAPLS